jgi:hypothetical protein
MRQQKGKSRGGSVVLDRRRNEWRYYGYRGGKRYSVSLGKHASKRRATQAAEELKQQTKAEQSTGAPTVGELIEAYLAEKAPQRYSTRKCYVSWMRSYIQPQWGSSPITDLQARPVETWLRTLPANRTQ